VPVSQSQLAAAGLTAEELLANEPGRNPEVLLQAYFAQIRGNLAEARRFARRLSRPERAPFLPLALVGSYVHLLERQGGGALREEGQIMPLNRVWKVAAAHMFGL
jgi:phytoene/squalene synthetase